jgi:Ca2+-binding EF-hand superfamily protein
MATEPTLPQSTDITQSTNQPADVSQQARMFEVLDQDRDGFVSKLEAKNHIDHYSKADSNNDGRLDRGEFAVIELNDIETKTNP